MFISLTNEHATVIRQKLLEALFYESDSNTRKKISDAVADLARQYTDNGQHSHLEALQIAR